MSKFCHTLSNLLELCLGANWRTVLFAERYVTVELCDYYDEVLLLSLSIPDGPQVILFDLLRQTSKLARLAHRLFLAWRSASGTTGFPSPEIAHTIIQCANAIIQNRSTCDHWGNARSCPLSLLSLLHLRLGCLFSDVCCSMFCYVGCDYPHLVCGKFTGFLLSASSSSFGEHLRIVTIASKVPSGNVPLFRFHSLNKSVLFVSVCDSVLAAKERPMQLTALRASLTHRIYLRFSIRWLCPLTGRQCASIYHQPKRALPDFAATAFRDGNAAKQWTALACALQQVYSEKSVNAELSALQASTIMCKMAELFPFACCNAVQRLLRFPFLNISLCTQGRFIYCLVSPFLSKLYVGAVGFKKPRAPYARLREHLSTAKTWASRASVRRYGRRTPSMYSAIAKIGASNVIQVILAEATQENLSATEYAFIRQLSPVFNVLGVSADVALPRAIQRLLGSSLCEDIRLVGAKLLRHNRPNIPAQAWPALIAGIRRTGDRDLAAKVARQARQVCPKLSKLRSSPRLMFPCPIPKRLLNLLSCEVRAVLRALPFVCRSLHFELVVEAGSLGWQKTPFADILLAPSKLSFQKVGPCRCQNMNSEFPRLHGHVITRAWDKLPYCRSLADLGINSSFQCRTFPPLERICEVFGHRIRRILHLAGFTDEHLGRAQQNILESVRRILAPWMARLPIIMQQTSLVRIRHETWRSGMVLARIDRNPGRLVAMCRDLWMELQKSTFLRNERYCIVNLPPSDDDISYPEEVRNSFLSAVPGSEAWIGRKPSGPKLRPQSYWTVKQKSLSESSQQPVAKVRPLVMHSVHPLRISLGRVARAASVLVCEVRLLVMKRRSSHLPMWQMHSGSKEWLQRISSTINWWGCDEYDVNDCFLNTPRHEVLDSARFWLAVTTEISRKQPCFAISKDGNKGDHRGRPSSVHYWEITCQQLLNAFEWELDCNNTFEVQTGDGAVAVVQQRKGLPIGGHLSAAFVELVALRREYVHSWPAMLLRCPTARYRDNFFVVLQEEPTEAQRQATAHALSMLLAMPVVFERGGREARCLELRISWLNGTKVKATLAYRTDPDRQGESQDVRTWPDWGDPRAPLVLHGLLAGLASKLVTYSHEAIGGFPASLRKALQFLRDRHYPTKVWLRPFALQLARLGVPFVALPRALRKVIQCCDSPLLLKGENVEVTETNIVNQKVELL